MVSNGLSGSRLGFALGWDHTWTVAVQYGHGLDRVVSGREVELFAELSAPILNVPELDAGRLEFGGQLLLAGSSGLGVVTMASTGLGLSNDATGSQLGILYALAARPGYYTASGAVALDLRLLGTATTYIWHSERVRDLFRDRYPEGNTAGTLGPKDGFYAFAATRARLGLSGGYLPGTRWAAMAEGGFELQPQVDGVLFNPAIGGMPFYTRVQGGYRW